jgi:hypothetical protein
MSKVLLKNTNPLGYVNVPDIGRVGEPDDANADVEGAGCLRPGEVFECDSEVAGVAPFWRDATDADAEAIKYGQVGVRTRPETTGEGDDATESEVTEVLDLGYGLLAQVGNFEAAGDPLEKSTIPELKQYAEVHKVALGDAKTKADILAAIRKG